MNKSIVTLIGFLLLIFGVLNLAVMFIGVKFAPFLFLDMAGEGIGFLIRLLMVLVGIVMIVLSRTEFDGGTLPEE